SPAASGRAQLQGRPERLKGLAGPSCILGQEPERVQGGGLAAGVLRLADEGERGIEPLAGLSHLSQVAVELPPVEQDVGPLAGIIARRQKGERAVKGGRRLVVAPAPVE